MPHTKTASQRLHDLKNSLAFKQFLGNTSLDFIDDLDVIIKQVEFLEKSVEREVERLGLKPHDENDPK